MILAPQLALFLYIAVAAFGMATWLGRARLRRVAGSLAGGAVLALVWLARLGIDDSMGWWKSAFAESPDLFRLLPLPLVLPIIALTGAWILIISWRIARRFGWAAHALFFLALALHSSVRDRIWWGEFMRVMVISNGAVPILADSAVLAADFALGHALMRFIAGPAGKDPLARAR